MAGVKRKSDFFVSHAGPNSDWAEWVAVSLEDAGYSVQVDRSWRAGENWVQLMQDALESSEWMIALYSRAYFENVYSRRELQSWWSKPDGDQQLIPFRVEPVDEIPALYRPTLYADLFGQSDVATLDVLLKAVNRVRPRRQESKPPVAKPKLGKAWHVPARNPSFTGREEIIKRIHARLNGGDRAVVQALRGMGGVGKTQVATEYAHLYQGEYDQVWWINSDQPELIAQQLADLAAATGVATRTTPVPDAIDALRAELRENSRWLIIFDNAGSPDDISAWLPPGLGHMLLTSREPNWTGLAVGIDIGTFTRPESIKMLRHEVRGLTPHQANKLANQLGDLPLAIAQAAGTLTVTGMPLVEYEQMLTGDAGKALSQNKPTGYGHSLASSVGTALLQLAQVNPAALALARICSLLAPEPVPLDLFTAAPAEVLPPVLVQRRDDVFDLAHAVRRVGLALRTKPGTATLQFHRLTRAIIADSMTPNARETAKADAEAIVAASMPDDGNDPRHWPRWRQLMPHVLALEPGNSANPGLRQMANNGVWYQLSLGDVQSAFLTARSLLDTLSVSLGAEHVDTMQAAQNLAACHYQQDNYAKARDLDQQTLARRKLVLGPEHPDTLASASDLALDLHELGLFESARDLNRQTYGTRERLFGRAHEQTLTSANNLAMDLQALHDFESALPLLVSCYETRRDALGAKHVSTLVSAANLADLLFSLGSYTEARELEEKTWEARKRLLGADHPDTDASARSLIRVLRVLGEHTTAKEIESRLRRVKRRPPDAPSRG